MRSVTFSQCCHLPLDGHDGDFELFGRRKCGRALVGDVALLAADIFYLREMPGNSSKWDILVALSFTMLFTTLGPLMIAVIFLPEPMALQGSGEVLVDISWRASCPATFQET